MNAAKVLGGVACLSLLLGTGALAEMVGGEPGTSKNPKDNVPKEIQRDTPSGGDFGKGGSGPGSRSDALTGMKKEKAVGVTEEGLEQNVDKTHEGGAAVAAEELKEEGEKSQKDISAQSAHKDMKKNLPKKELEQADPPVKE
ncbi:MAG: hypothetical protein CO149_08405 [Nitrospirae bacterium CG_4_9_14_3_um_filter_51_5]|nr:MAG: hypothetical protein CO149_08405 [Nitrospirae bacterium CG_4_9_14_3_um_filter_51_5]